MKPRAVLILALTLVLLAAPLAAEAQQAGRACRIGGLKPAVVEGYSRASREALRALGYVKGQTVSFELRSAEDELGLTILRSGLLRVDALIQ